MRIAVLTDVHGNRFALEAVLEDIRASSPDAVANLGDQLRGLADPAGAYALQRELGAVEVRGNADEEYSGDAAAHPSAWPEVGTPRGLLPPQSVTHLAGLPTTATLADGEVVLCHGQPGTPWTGLTQVREADGFREASDAELRERLASFGRPKAVVAGHLHRERFRSSGGVVFVNVGPVAYQNDGDPAARWVLLERRRGAWNVSFRRTPCDHEAAARRVETRFPDARDDAFHLREGRFPPRTP